MNRAIIVTSTENQTTMPSRICRIIFDYISLCD